MWPDYAKAKRRCQAAIRDDVAPDAVRADFVDEWRCRL